MIYKDTLSAATEHVEEMKKHVSERANPESDIYYEIDLKLTFEAAINWFKSSL